MASKATLPVVVVDVASSDTLSDPSVGRHVNLDPGHLTLHEESLFPPKAPASTPVTQHPSAFPKEETRHREEKHLYLCMMGNIWRRKFHYHLTRPLFSKRMAAQYKPLTDPYATLAQFAMNDSHVLARHADHLARVNGAVSYQLKCQKKSISIKNELLQGLEVEQTSLRKEMDVMAKTADEQAKRVEDLTGELVKEMEVAKSWDVERADLIS
ncbi:hypothetical protein LIER_01083 [Lithospermum erythrorhizon]|uniref:Uncharacterized protein n=1 Tax=Lithospermum erythrorhizon TaxID=34254 RepID=A0AAV3NNA9_LITER